MKNVAHRKPERVVFVVLRGISTNFQFVEPEWNPTVGEPAEKSDKTTPDDKKDN